MAPDNISRVLGDITNYTIGNITTVNPRFSVHSSNIEKEFDQIVSDVIVSIEWPCSL